jgi:RNA polymerase sigma-70 factor (ECF subfamily)
MTKGRLEGLDDEALMRAVQGDDVEAFDELAQRFQPRLFHFCLRRLSQRQAAEDAVQETLLRAWKHRHSFRQDAKVSTWVFTLAVNLCRDHWRKSKPESSLSRPEVAIAAEWSSLRRPDDSPEDLAQDHQLAELLLQALETLPPQTAALLKAKGSQDLTLEEAGKLVGLSPSAARAAASRAYKKLKAFLQKKDR